MCGRECGVGWVGLGMKGVCAICGGVRGEKMCGWGGRCRGEWIVGMFVVRCENGVGWRVGVAVC